MTFSHRISQKLHRFFLGLGETGKGRQIVLCSVSCRVNLWLVVFWVLAAAAFACEYALAEAQRTTMVSLYFMDAEKLELAAERRTINQAANTVEQIKLTVVELIKGPTTALVSTIPEETEVREVFLDEKGCAYVDFSRAISQNHPGGTTGELITISSIVNTLTENFPEEIRKVRILIGGKETGTIAGHIDISRPIFPFAFE